MIPASDPDPDPCPLCGGRVTYRGLHEIECVTAGCANGGHPVADPEGLERAILAWTRIYAGDID